MHEQTSKDTLLFHQASQRFSLDGVDLDQADRLEILIDGHWIGVTMELDDSVRSPYWFCLTGDGIVILVRNGIPARQPIEQRSISSGNRAFPKNSGDILTDHRQPK